MIRFLPVNYREVASSSGSGSGDKKLKPLTKKTYLIKTAEQRDQFYRILFEISSLETQSYLKEIVVLPEP